MNLERHEVAHLIYGLWVFDELHSHIFYRKVWISQNMTVLLCYS